jgi:NitT/TauT family transport system permease protein
MATEKRDPEGGRRDPEVGLAATPFFRVPPLRRPTKFWMGPVFGSLSILLFFAIWWFLTLGEPEERIISPASLPSPKETFATFHSLWFDRALTRNLFVTLKRVMMGFALAFVVGVPLGILAGCFSWFRMFLAPVVIFGRNIPLAALIPLTFIFFGVGETQKVMFIFIACVAFIIADAALAITDVSTRYLDTAYTLGANTWQSIIKVLVPLAMPTILDSARLLFGLAFGYIMLAELIRFGDEVGGIGNLILMSQRRGPREHIFLIVLIIPIVALILDRIFYWVQRQLFPHRYGGLGLLNQALRSLLLDPWDDLKSKVRKPRAPFEQLVPTTDDKPQ